MTLQEKYKKIEKKQTFAIYQEGGCGEVDLTRFEN